MNNDNLIEVYESISPGVKKIFVVPLIRFNMKQTDYLFLLYKNFFESNNSGIKIKSLSAAAHPEFFFSRVKKEKSVLHYHWFEVHDVKSLIGMLWKMLWIKLYKLSGGKIVWTIHNKFPHTNNFSKVNNYCRKHLAELADKIHVHCSFAVEIMSEKLSVNKNKFFVLKHPEFPAKLIDNEKAKKLLTEKYPTLKFDNKKSFLMFGAIADYKGIKEAAVLFKNDFTDQLLIIAGQVKPWDQKYFDELLLEINDCENIIVIKKMIPEEEVPLFFNSVDYALFNYKDILTSGGVIMALAYNKKIITPSIGCIEEFNSKNIIKFNPGNGSENLKQVISEL